mgnify:FL=1
MQKEIKNNKKIRFNYINDSVLSNKLKEWAIKNNFEYQIIDEWEAPRLVLNEEDLKKYISICPHSQISKNYKLYCNKKEKLNFYNSVNCDSLMLWNYVLQIDYNSWKKDEHSDMKSLDREDLQYLPFFLIDKEHSNLIVVCDEKNNPLAYSLMFRSGDCWYAVKWGASNLGRKYYAGFYCLFYHLEYLYSLDNKLMIDFWGRRNKTYDELKNDYIIRKHIVVYKKE